MQKSGAVFGTFACENSPVNFFRKNFANDLVFKNPYCYLCPAFERRPVRLGVRTQDFHSCNTGSIPVRATTEIPQRLVSQKLMRRFLFAKCGVREKTREKIWE